MGITIHFEGRLRGPSELATLVKEVTAFAEERAWPTQKIDEREVTLRRDIDDEERQYVGPTSGIEVHPHPDAEYLRFEFDQELFVQEYCKTQFAGPSVHMQIIDILKQVAPLFIELKIYDEGDYWSTQDQTVLQKNFLAFEEAFKVFLANHPDARGPVRLGRGRIVDAIGG